MSLTQTVFQYINRLQVQYYTTPYEDLVELGIFGRIKLYDWSLELAGLAVLVVVIILFNVGAYSNESIVKKFLTTVKPVLDENFYQVGTKKDELYIKDSPTIYTSYATGRTLISGLTLKFNLISRQNYLTYFTESILSFFLDSIPTPEDTVDILIRPGADSKIGNFIFSIVNKSGMNKYREDNYFLSLTKTTESDKLPTNYVFMSESTELNQSLVDDELISVLSRSSSLVKFLTVTDLPTEKPTSEKELESYPELVLRLNLKTDSTSLGLARDLIDQLILLNDRLAKFQLKPDQAKKLANVRQTELSKIQKAIQEKKAEELKEAKLEAERETRRELAKKNPEAQEKLEQKQREKRERRAKNKQVRRA